MAVLVQTDGLDVNEVPDGYVVYQPVQDRVHYLNATAAVIFEYCDGLQSADEIVAQVATAFELPETRQDEIRACLDNLVKEGLVAPRA
jgi:PqqD family protein of HPr-rel-A system